MFKWMGRGMPGLMFVMRKPEPLGAEYKTLADGDTGVMLHMELQEGKERMQKKQFVKEFGATCACTLRICQFWWGTGRIVIGDSWFGSVKTVVQLFIRGLHAMCNVKTAHKNYSRAQVKKICPEGRVVHGSVTCELPAKPGKSPYRLLATCWRRCKFLMYLICTCSADLPGLEKHYKSYTLQNGEVEITEKTLPRPKCMVAYKVTSPVIDAHNHQRQATLGLESLWITTVWWHRHFCCIFTTAVVNAYRAYKHFHPAIWQRNVFVYVYFDFKPPTFEQPMVGV